MIKNKSKRITTLVLALILCIGVLISTSVLVMSASVAANSSSTNLNGVSGKYMWGAPDVTDPSPVEKTAGVYYAPTSYVYFGSYYDSVTGENIPVINRVLDADADNAGNAGAIFLLTENGISAENFYFYSQIGLPSSLIETENVYTHGYVYLGATDGIFSTTDEAFLRAVTKSDKKAELQDLFTGYIEGIDTYYLETDSVDLSLDLGYRDVIHGDEAKNLNESEYFLLSAKEIYDYIATYHGAPSLKTTNIQGDSITWWTRTGLGESYDWSTENPYNTGNFVLGVDASGNLVPVSVDDTAVYTRLGFNLEKSRIAYSQKVNSNTYRLAFEHSLYSGEENGFSAEVIKNYNGNITLRYSGTVVLKDTSTDKGYITVVIEDGDGNIKYYGNIAEAVTDYGYGYISSEVGEATFTLPSDYNSETDKISVFWEQKAADENATGYISNIVTVDCVHSDATDATCAEKAVCNDCGTVFGDVDLGHHTGIGSAYTTENTGTHWKTCEDCGTEIAKEACTYSNLCLSYCVKCGSPKVDRNLCQYDENGLCLNTMGHYEPPVYIKESRYTRVIIENEGQWLSFAETVNSGEVIYGDDGYWVYADRMPVRIELVYELDFTYINFIPIGNENHYVTGEFITTNDDVSIKGINYSSEDSCVGLFGHARDFSIREIILTDCTFSGKSNVGALVGLGAEVSISQAKVIDDVTVSASDGSEGAFIGTAVVEDGGSGKSSITSASVAINVKNKEQVDLAFSSNGNITVSNSYCLFASDGEDGKTSAETFASGSVTYKLHSVESGWSQIIDKVERDVNSGKDKELTPDPFPRYIPRGEDGKRVEKTYPIYMISYCDGTAAKLTNNSTRSYTVHKPKEILEWIWNVQDCEARLICELCGSEETVVAHVTLDYTYVPVRGDYTATILDPHGNAYTDSEGNVFSDEITIIGIRIESMIGMTNIEKVYDGTDISPEDLMNNHRLNTGTPYPAAKEYEVYFVNSETGEIIAETYTDISMGMFVEVTSALPVSDAGVYDLLVIGKNDYEGQSYTYKAALTILPAIVEIEPLDVYKYYDGNAHFEPKYNFTDTDSAKYYDGLFSLSYEGPGSSAEGVYELGVSVTTSVDDSNLRFVLTKDTVRAVILPALYVSVENKNYPTEFTYGDTVTAPTEANFNFTSGSRLSFEWYSADLYKWREETYIDGKYVFVDKYEVLSMSRLDGVPKNVGDYILRVKASASGDFAASYLDIWVRINAANTLSIELELDGYEKYGDDYYIVNMGDEIKYSVSGLVGDDTIETADISVDINVEPAYGNSGVPCDQGKFPDQPNSVGYRVIYTVSSNGEDGNYETVRESVYVIIKAQGAKPLGNSFIYDGAAQSFDIVLSWTLAEGVEEYRLEITDADSNLTKITRTVGDQGKDIRNGNAFAVYTASVAGTHTVNVYVGENIVQSFTFDVEIKDEDGNTCDNIIDIGRYEVKVVTGGNGTEPSSVAVYVKREIVMYVKECEYDLDSGKVIFDPTQIVMEAGKVIMLGHTLADVNISVDAFNGEIEVASFKVVDKNGNDVSHYYQLNSTYISWSHDNSDGLNIAHIFYSYCDSTCNVAGCEYTRQRAHSGGSATCTDLAICEHCHGPYGDYSAVNHVSEATHIAPNAENLNTHLLVHSCCGRTAEVLEHTLKTHATCLDLAVCADCGWEYGSVDPENHVSENCTYHYIGEDGHKTVRTCCGAEVFEAHSGGEANCQSKAVCLYCLKEYGDTDPDNHKGHIDYVPDENNAGYHTEKYSCCNTSATVAHSGGVETCISLAVCQHCGAEYGELDPHNHASENIVYTVRADNNSMHDMERECCGEYLGKEYHSGGDGNCISSAVCQRCDAEYTVGLNLENHASEKTIYVPDPNNENVHIKIHACCGAEIERREHSGGEASCLHGKLCEYCGKEYSESTEHVYADACTSVCSVCNKQTRAEKFHSDSDEDGTCDDCQAELPKNNISGGAVSAIVTGSVVVSGTGGFSLFWFVIKKKNWSELLRLLIG